MKVILLAAVMMGMSGGAYAAEFSGLAVKAADLEALSSIEGFAGPAVFRSYVVGDNSSGQTERLTISGADAPALAIPEPSPAQAGKQGTNQEINGVIRRFLSDYQGALAADIAAIEAGASGADPGLALPAFRDLYYRVTVSLLPRISSAMEVNNAREFFSGFFVPEDNDPEILRIFQYAADNLAQGRIRRDLVYKTAALSDMGLMGMTKGGDLIVISADAVKWERGEQAAMIAHEMAHLDARHYVRDLIVARINEMVLSGVSEGGRLKVKGAAEYAKRDSRHQAEFDADAAAVGLMRNAGYDPLGLLRLLQRADAQGGSSGGSGDHPALKSRIQRIRSML